MRFTLKDNEIRYGNNIIDIYNSKGEAMAVMNMLEAAYGDGIADERESRRKLVEESRNKVNLRKVLVGLAWVLALILLYFLLTFTEVATFVALIVSVALYIVAYVLGRIDRVTF